MRIYYNNQCIYFNLEPNNLINKEGLTGSIAIREEFDIEFFEDDFELLKKHEIDHLIYTCDPEVGFDFMADFFKLIQAGGGIVWNENNELLMINRLGKWDLPKGKLDPGENLEECAVREVMEETGLSDIVLDQLAKATYHIYKMKDRWILKYTEWYLMRAPMQKLVPQEEEDISQADWIAKDEIALKLKNSYPNIIYLLKGIV